MADYCLLVTQWHAADMHCHMLLDSENALITCSYLLPLAS